MPHLSDPHRDQPLRTVGSEVEEAEGALVCLHGRGATAGDILGLGRQVAPSGWAVWAPQAAAHTWYPQSFLSPLEENQPWLDSALDRVGGLVEDLAAGGLSKSRIALLGFSQGACLAAEWAGRHPARWAGLVILTGGFQGPLDRDPGFRGSFEGTPVLLASGDPDPHIPWSRAEATAVWFREMGADVDLRRYPGRPHSVSAEEVELARNLLRAPPGDR